MVKFTFVRCSASIASLLSGLCYRQRTSLFKAIADTTHADYVTVNLENGDSWLTSRLFVLSTLIARVRPIQRIVFLEGPTEHFVGESSPLAVGRALAQAYPWLEDAYISAHLPEKGGKLEMKQNCPLLAPIAPDMAGYVLRSYLQNVQQAAGSKIEGWIDLGGYMEHAAWVSGESLIQLLRTNINTIAVKRDPSQDGTVTARTLLRSDGDYVAIVDMVGRFLNLVDRRKATDQVVRQSFHSSNTNAPSARS